MHKLLGGLGKRTGLVNPTIPGALGGTGAIIIATSIAVVRRGLRLAVRSRSPSGPSTRSAPDVTAIEDQTYGSGYRLRYVR